MAEGPSKQARSDRRAKRHYDAMREKVVQNLRDLWRGYHGSTASPETEDGNRLMEKKKSGGHIPLNAAVMAFWDPEPGSRQDKLGIARELVSRQLYRLACGTAEEVTMFSEIQDLFRDYGAGDSDYDELRKKAATYGPESQSARRLAAVDEGIDRITTRLIRAGVTGREFWADFGWGGTPTSRGKTAADKDRERYLMFEKECNRLRAAGASRYRNKALKAVAEARGEAKSTIEEAVAKVESGYLEPEAS